MPWLLASSGHQTISMGKYSIVFMIIPVYIYWNVIWTNVGLVVKGLGTDKATSHHWWWPISMGGAIWHHWTSITLTLFIQAMEYTKEITLPIPGLLMPWFHVSPRHHRSYHWVITQDRQIFHKDGLLFAAPSERREIITNEDLHFVFLKKKMQHR